MLAGLDVRVLALVRPQVVQFTLDAGETTPSSAISVEEALYFFGKPPQDVAS